jgi:acetyl-CoA synthetase
MKVSGKRIGPGEVESVLSGHPLVAEAAVIGVPHELKGETIVGFVVVSPGTVCSSALSVELIKLVTEKLGHSLRPEAVHFVESMPKTRSGKIVRGSIRRKHLGEAAGDTSSVENPDALDRIPARVNPAPGPP